MHGRPKTIAFFYPGELGGVMARALASRGHRIVTTLEGRSARTRDRSAGLEVLPSMADAVRVADVVISLVVPRAAIEVAAAVAAHAKDTANPPLFIDANALSHAVMLQIDTTLRASGARVADAAFFGSARDSSRGRIYVSGPEAQSVVELFDGAVETLILSDEIGDASTFKLLYSGLHKGMAALLFEIGTAAHARGFLEPLLREYRSSSVGAVLDDMVPGYVAHARRRGEELRDLASDLHALGTSARISEAASRTIAQVAQVAFGDVATAAADPTAAVVACVAGSGNLRDGDPE